MHIKNAGHFARHFLCPKCCANMYMQITIPIWNIWNVYEVYHPFVMIYSIAFERFELGSSRVRVVFEQYQTILKEILSLIQYLIRLEPGSNPARNTSNYESHLEHSEKPLDMFYSIAFERFELGSTQFD